MDYTTLTLSQLMSYKSDRVRRQAIAIFKMLPEETAKIGRAYAQDAMKRATDKDRKQAEDHTADLPCEVCGALAGIPCDCK